MCDQDSQFWMGGIHASNLLEVTNNPDHLDDGSFWAVSISFEGEKTFLRFADVTQRGISLVSVGKLSGKWISSQSERDYIAYVERIRRTILKVVCIR
jgi:para-aminobenzoate synthetase component 1